MDRAGEGGPLVNVPTFFFSWDHHFSRKQNINAVLGNQNMARLIIIFRFQEAKRSLLLVQGNTM